MATGLTDEQLFEQVPMTGLPESPAPYSGPMARPVEAPMAAPATAPMATVPAPVAPSMPMPSVAPVSPKMPSTLAEAGELNNEQIKQNLAGIEAGYELKKQAEVAGAASGIKKATEQTAMFDKMENTQQERAEATRKRNAQDAASFAKAQDDFVTLTKTLSESTIDPGRLWNNMSTGNKIATSIGILLGGFSTGGGKKGSNPMLDGLNLLIERDIDSQRNDIATKKEGVQNQYQLYQMMRQKFGDGAQADAAAQMAAVDILKVQIEKKASQYAAPEIKERAATAIADLEQGKQKYMLAFNVATQDKIEKAKAFQQQSLMNKNIQSGADVDTASLSKETMDRAQSLRQEYNKQTKELGTEEVLSSHGQIKKFAVQDSPAADIGLVYSYMKILDPGSTVREGEFSTAQNAAGVPDQIRNAYNKAMQGTRLNDKQRTDFMLQADKLADNKIEKQKIVNAKYTKLSQDSLVPAKLVVQEYGKPVDANTGKVDQLMKNNPGLTRDQALGALKKAGYLVK